MQFAVKPAADVSCPVARRIAPEPFYLVIFEVAFVHWPTAVEELALAPDHTSVVAALVLIAVFKFCLPEAVLQVFLPFSIVFGSSSILIWPYSMLAASVPPARVSVPVRKLQSALAMRHPGLKLSIVFWPVAKPDGPFPRELRFQIAFTWPNLQTAFDAIETMRSKSCLTIF